MSTIDDALTRMRRGGIQWPHDVERLLSVADALLKEHCDEPLYEDAGNCEHPQPPESGPGDRYSYTLDQWYEDHPVGTEANGESSGERICELTEIGRYCPACSMLIDDGEFVPVSECLVRPTITRVLGGAEPGPETAGR